MAKKLIWNLEEIFEKVTGVRLYHLICDLEFRTQIRNSTNVNPNL